MGATHGDRGLGLRSSGSLNAAQGLRPATNPPQKYSLPETGIKNRMPHASQQLCLGGWACCFRMRDSRASDGVLDSGFGRWDGALLLASPAMLGGLCVAATSRAVVFC